MSEISIYLPYVLSASPFLVAGIILFNSRRKARLEAAAADYERFVWPDQSEEMEEDEAPVRRRYISYSM